MFVVDKQPLELLWEFSNYIGVVWPNWRGLLWGYMVRYELEEGVPNSL